MGRLEECACAENICDLEAWPRWLDPTLAPEPTMRLKFSEVLKRRPAGRGGARDERRSDYSRIPDGSDSYPQESHELAAIPTSSAQPGSSNLSRSPELDGAENLRLQARKQGEKRAKLLERAQKAFESGKFRLWEKLKRLAEKCLELKAKFNNKAADIIFRGKLRW